MLCLSGRGIAMDISINRTLHTNIWLPGLALADCTASRVVAILILPACKPDRSAIRDFTRFISAIWLRMCLRSILPSKLGRKSDGRRSKISVPSSSSTPKNPAIESRRRNAKFLSRATKRAGSGKFFNILENLEP